MQVNPSISHLVEQQFPPQDQSTVLSLLSTYGAESYEREVARVQRAILTLAKGQLDQVAYLVGAAKVDYRDVLWWAEYPADHAQVLKQVKDLIQTDLPMEDQD